MDWRCQTTVSVKVQRAAESSETLWQAGDTFKKDVDGPIAKGHFGWPAVEYALASRALDHETNVNERVVALYSLLERYKLLKPAECTRLKELLDLVLDDEDNISVLMVYHINGDKYPSTMETFKYKEDTLDLVDLNSEKMYAVVNTTCQQLPPEEPGALIKRLLGQFDQADGSVRNRQYLSAMFEACVAIDQLIAGDIVVPFVDNSKQGWYVSELVVRVFTDPTAGVLAMASEERFAKCQANLTSVDFVHRIVVAKSFNWQRLLYAFVEGNLVPSASSNTVQLLAKLLISLDEKHALRPPSAFKPLFGSFLKYLAYTPEARTLYQRSLKMVDDDYSDDEQEETVMVVKPDGKNFILKRSKQEMVNGKNTTGIIQLKK